MCFGALIYEKTFRLNLAFEILKTIIKLHFRKNMLI